MRRSTDCPESLAPQVMSTNNASDADHNNGASSHRIFSRRLSRRLLRCLPLSATVIYHWFRRALLMPPQNTALRERNTLRRVWTQRNLDYIGDVQVGCDRKGFNWEGQYSKRYTCPCMTLVQE